MNVTKKYDRLQSHRKEAGLCLNTKKLSNNNRENADSPREFKKTKPNEETIFTYNLN